MERTAEQVAAEHAAERAQMSAISRSMSSYKTGAKARGITYELTYGFFVSTVLSPCHYCGGRTEGKMLNGIDRCDPWGNYTPDNCVPCCTPCNMAKGTMTERQFMQLVLRIVKNQIARRRAKPA